MARFLVVPQWQGSPSARAMLLGDGARAIAEDLPRAVTTVLDVPLEAGEALGTPLRRLSSLQRIRTMIAESLSADEMNAGADNGAEHPVVIGGDGSVTVSALSALSGTDDLAVVWCAAHPALHTTGTSPTGAFSEMALRAILGDDGGPLTLRPGIAPDRVIAVGTREVSPDEEEVLSALARVRVEELVDPDALAEAVRRSGAARLWIHIDVDVLDPAELSGVFSPEPFGTTAATLGAALRAARVHAPLAGATVAGFAPRTLGAADEDLGAVLRLIGSVA